MLDPIKGREAEANLVGARVHLRLAIQQAVEAYVSPHLRFRLTECLATLGGCAGDLEEMLARAAGGEPTQPLSPIVAEAATDAPE